MPTTSGSRDTPLRPSLRPVACTGLPLSRRTSSTESFAKPIKIRCPEDDCRLAPRGSARFQSRGLCHLQETGLDIGPVSECPNGNLAFEQCTRSGGADPAASLGTGAAHDPPWRRSGSPPGPGPQPGRHAAGAATAQARRAPNVCHKSRRCPASTAAAVPLRPGHNSPSGVACA